MKKLVGTNEIWEVELTLTSDNDSELRALTEQMQKETSLGAKGWIRLAQLMMKLAQYDKAKELSELLLKQTNDQNEKQHIYHMLGMIKHGQGKYAEAVEYYGKSLELMKKTLPESHPNLATSYNNIGLVYDSMGEYSKALEYYGKSLEIKKKTLSENHPDFAQTYNNIAIVYYNMTDYKKGLEYFQRALDIWTRSLPPNHPNIKTVRDSMEVVRKKL